MRVSSATHCPDTLRETGLTTTDKMNQQLEEEGPRSGIFKCFSCHTKDISTTTQPLTSDTTKSRQSKACCTEANGHVTKHQLAIKVKKEKNKQTNPNSKPLIKITNNSLPQNIP